MWRLVSPDKASQEVHEAGVAAIALLLLACPASVSFSLAWLIAARPRLPAVWSRLLSGQGAHTREASVVNRFLLNVHGRVQVATTVVYGDPISKQEPSSSSSSAA